jgi:hypothetical protein
MINKFKNFITENYSEEFQKRDIVVGDKIELDPFVDGEYWDDFNFSKNTTYKIEIVSINGDDVECELLKWNDTHNYYEGTENIKTLDITDVVDMKHDSDVENYYDTNDTRKIKVKLINEIGADKLIGGSLSDSYSAINELIEVINKFKSVVNDFDTDNIKSALNPTMFQIQNGKALKVLVNQVHQGGYYAGSTPFFIQLQIGGALKLTVKQALLAVAKFILDKYTVENDYGKSRNFKTDGTAWSSWAMASPQKNDRYYTLGKLNDLN